jgi:hypothetical protein
MDASAVPKVPLREGHATGGVAEKTQHATDQMVANGASGRSRLMAGIRRGPNEVVICELLF